MCIRIIGSFYSTRPLPAHKVIVVLRKGFIGPWSDNLLPFDMWHTAMYEPDGKGLHEELEERRTGQKEWRTSDKLGFCCFPLQHAAYRYVAFCGRGLVVPVAVMGRIYIGHDMDGLRVDVVWAAEKLMVTGHAAHGVATHEAHILSTKGLRQ